MKSYVVDFFFYKQLDSDINMISSYILILYDIVMFNGPYNIYFSIISITCYSKISTNRDDFISIHWWYIVYIIVNFTI